MSIGTNDLHPDFKLQTENYGTNFFSRFVGMKMAYMSQSLYLQDGDANLNEHN